MNQLKIYMMRASGKGTHDERFFSTKAECAEAYAEIVLGSAQGDPVLSDQQQEEVDWFMGQINDQHMWHQGHFHVVIGETGRVDIHEIDAQVFRRLLSRAMDEWLGIGS